jgi:hypothetical protein
MAEMAAAEMASMPPTPPPAVAPPASNGRVPTPAATPAVAQPKSPEPAQVEVEGRPLGRRPSSEFNALESDFFAREADLYKQDHPESFDDLDHGRKGPPRK